MHPHQRVLLGRAGIEREVAQAAAPAPAPRARRKKRRAAEAVQEVPAAPQPHLPMEGIRLGVQGLAAFGVLAGGFVLGRKLLGSQLPKVQKVRIQA